MSFTAEQKDELKALLIQVMDSERERRMERARKEREENPPQKDVKLYLVTLSGHQIAFPDERGRAVLNQTFYARVPMNKNDPSFYGGRIEVVAFGDGRRLEKTIGVVLASHVAAMVEADESQLKDTE